MGAIPIFPSNGLATVVRLRAVASLCVDALQFVFGKKYYARPREIPVK